MSRHRANGTERVKRRKRGVTLTLLDVDDLNTRVTAEYRRKVPDTTWDELHLGWTPWAAVEHNGHLWVVCVEGVMYDATDDGMDFEFYGQTSKTPTATSFSMLPVCSINMPPDDIRERMTGDTVDLADLIRTFGSRLEQNYWTAYRILTEEAEQESVG